MKEAKPTSQTAADAAHVRELLLATTGDTILTYLEVADALGKEVSGTKTAVLRARKGLESEGIHFETLRMIGYRRMPADGFASAAKADMMAIRRKTKRSLRRCHDAPIDKMSAKAKLEQMAAASVLGAVASVAGDSTYKKHMQAAIAQSKQVELPEGMKVIK